MHPTRLAGLVLLLALGACVPRPAPPPPAPPPPAPAPPPPPPPPAPAPVAWEDALPAPGDWSYRAEGGGSVATFGPAQNPQLVIRCEPSRQVSVIRMGATGGSLVVRTSFGDRALPGTGRDGGVAATLAAADPLLDWMAFSRGRFAVEADGLPRLVVQTWPEPARVIEDCRG